MQRCVNVFPLSLFYFQQKKDARITVGMFHEDQARKVFCEVNDSQYVVCSLNLECIERFHMCSSCSTLHFTLISNFKVHAMCRSRDSVCRLTSKECSVSITCGCYWTGTTTKNGGWRKIMK